MPTDDSGLQAQARRVLDAIATAECCGCDRTTGIEQLEDAIAQSSQ